MLNFSELLKKIVKRDTKPCLHIIPDSDGWNFVFDRSIEADPDACAAENTLFSYQLVYLRQLQEGGWAKPIKNGFVVTTDKSLMLGQDFHALFSLPPFFDGSFELECTGVTYQDNFKAVLHTFKGFELSGIRLNGPCLEVGSLTFCLTKPQWELIHAFEVFNQKSAFERTEYDNNHLILTIQQIRAADKQRQEGMPPLKIKLGHFENLTAVAPEKVGISLTECPDGSFIPTPAIPGQSQAAVNRTISILEDAPNGNSVLHVGNSIVLFNEKTLNAVKKILDLEVIPKERLREFLKAPTAFIQDACIDLDNGFSIRVNGAEIFKHRYFGEVEATGIDWLDNTSQSLIEPLINAKDHLKDPAEVDDLIVRIASARKAGADCVEFSGRTYSITGSEASITRDIEKVRAFLSNPKTTEDAKPALRNNEQTALAIESNDTTVSTAAIDDTPAEKKTYAIDTSNLARLPLPHQKEGIQWVLNHYFTPSATGIRGGLLADDMGLGKTYTALASMEQIYKLLPTEGRELKPILVVAPLSLLSNWQAEIDATFKTTPFTDVVVLQAQKDLPRFRLQGRSRETSQQLASEHVSLDNIVYSLKVGKAYIPNQLDKAGRIVLCTYNTLRDYQFSLSRIDWSFVVFDEAQNLKNSNTLAAVAAKALNADFKLLVTGTPVENTLRDLWSLMDVALPGYLGAWQEFRTKYISPIIRASNLVPPQPAKVFEIKQRIGIQLRNLLGNHMLRRTKKSHLKGLPQKITYTGSPSNPSDEFQFDPALGGTMTGIQLETYDRIIDTVKNCRADDRRTLVLPSLHKLRLASIHPTFVNNDNGTNDFPADQSIKIQILDQLLNKIRGRNEKAIVFIMSKRVQRDVAVHLQKKFDIPVRIVNGDTNAVGDEETGEETRQSILADFQKRPGFGVIILSPIAVGVGLTVVGANNVIHLERHWNPAKESQATDRVYRIGQTKDVNVYLPMALHPSHVSFDLKINQLLNQKIDLSEAVMTQDNIHAEDMAGLFEDQ